MGILSINQNKLVKELDQSMHRLIYSLINEVSRKKFRLRKKKEGNFLFPFFSVDERVRHTTKHRERIGIIKVQPALIEEDRHGFWTGPIVEDSSH